MYMYMYRVAIFNRSTKYLVPSTWCQVLGPSSLCQVLGPKYLVPNAFELMPGTWYQVLRTSYWLPSI